MRERQDTLKTDSVSPETIHCLYGIFASGRHARYVVLFPFYRGIDVLEDISWTESVISAPTPSPDGIKVVAMSNVGSDNERTEEGKETDVKRRRLDERRELEREATDVKRR